MVIVNSNDITLFSIDVNWNISGATPFIDLTNNSQGSNLGGLTYWFEVLSPTTTPIHQGSASNPDKIGVWTNYTISDPWPRPFGFIEFGQYQITFYVKDSAGNIYNYTVLQTICPPQGNSIAKGTYGLGNINVQVECSQGSVYLSDETNTSYQGLSGTRLSSLITVVYPLDETDNLPTPFSANDFSSALVPITYNSPNYQYSYNSIYEYDFGNGSSVTVKYIKKETFTVACNINLCPIACEVANLVSQIENGTCNDADAANAKLIKITPLLMQAMIGQTQPTCGIDVAAIVEEIKSIGGFDCNCCNVDQTGIGTSGNAVIDGYNFSIVHVGGDINGNVVRNGNNIQFRLWDKSYVFQMSPTAPTTAFTITPSTSGDGYTKTYSLNVDLNLLANDLLTTIKNSSVLTNLFNSIVTPQTGLDLILDGGCIYQSASLYNYNFALSNIPAAPTFALLTSITIGATPTALSFSFNLSSLPALQTYLNGLDIGTFTVSAGSGGNISIISNNNTKVLSALTYKVSSTTYVATQTTSNAGYAPVTAQYVLQQIINYLCALDDTQLYTSEEYTVNNINITNGQIGTSVVPDDSELHTLIQTLLDNYNGLVKYVSSLSGVTCDKLKALFATRQNLAIDNKSVLYGVKGDQCSAMTPLEIFQYQLQNMDNTTQEMFCNAVEACGANKVCEAYTVFEVTVVPHSTTCGQIVGIQGTFS